MSIDGIAAIVFILFLGVFLWFKRNRVSVQGLFPFLYVLMYRSKLGIASMERLAKGLPKTIKAFGFVSVFVGFLGMIFICVELVLSTIKSFTSPEAVAGIQPVLPIEARGVFFVPFLYWIISIFLLAIVHEFAHGVVAKAFKIPVKSSGFAFLGLIVPIVPAAFVEPDENVVRKRSFSRQWAVFAAGPVSNIVFALLVLGVFALASPLASSAFDVKGMELTEVKGPALEAGLVDGDVLAKLNGIELTEVKNITSVMSTLSPGDVVSVETLNSSFTFAAGSHPENSSKAYLGVQAKSFIVPKEDFVAKYGVWLPASLKWILGLLFWLFMLNVGIGLFNLLPIGPLDGGRMFQLVCFKFFKNQSTALKVWSSTSLFFVIIIVANLLMGIF